MPEDYKVYLGNVPDDARERDVEKFFKGYGHVFNIILKVITYTFSNYHFFSPIYQTDFHHGTVHR